MSGKELEDDGPQGVIVRHPVQREDVEAPQVEALRGDGGITPAPGRAQCPVTPSHAQRCPAMPGSPQRCPVMPSEAQQHWVPSPQGNPGHIRQSQRCGWGSHAQPGRGSVPAGQHPCGVLGCPPTPPSPWYLQAVQDGGGVAGPHGRVCPAKHPARGGGVRADVGAGGQSWVLGDPPGCLETHLGAQGQTLGARGQTLGAGDRSGCSGTQLGAGDKPDC